MTGHSPPPPHLPDYGKIARLERDLYGETFHHVARSCCCDECTERRRQWDTDLHAQTQYAFWLSARDASLSS